ncbi:hypothetical protein [Streptomyces sp. NPDC052042]|uniref:hypothetical protein n=1 Tax=Streptomyces sp. NPDC052042 TaxID=3365683 RepID=UPI0037D19978
MRPLPEIPPAAVRADAEQAGAVLVEIYPRLARLGYLALPPALGRHRRVLMAHTLAQRALLTAHRAAGADHAEAPPPCRSDDPAAVEDPLHAYARELVVRGALGAGCPWRRVRMAPLPQVWGLRLYPHTGGSDELALQQALSALSGAGRAAYVLRGLERLPDARVRRMLAAAGVVDPHAALAEADGVPTPYALLDSPEFDPCSLQVRPPDLPRRRQYRRAVTAAVAALLVCGALLGPPGRGWGHDASPTSPRMDAPLPERALDADASRRVPESYRRFPPRADFASRPARGDRADADRPPRRTFAVRSAPDGTLRRPAAGGAPHPFHLRRGGGATTAPLHDGPRVMRYAEAWDGDPALYAEAWDGDCARYAEAGGGAVREGAALGFAQVDEADTASAGAPATGPTGERAEHLTAPWASAGSVRDPLGPDGAARPPWPTADGPTAPAGADERARPDGTPADGEWTGTPP